MKPTVRWLRSQCVRFGRHAGWRHASTPRRSQPSPLACAASAWSHKLVPTYPVYWPFYNIEGGVPTGPQASHPTTTPMSSTDAASRDVLKLSLASLSVGWYLVLWTVGIIGCVAA